MQRHRGSPPVMRTSFLGEGRVSDPAQTAGKDAVTLGGPGARAWRVQGHATSILPERTGKRRKLGKWEENFHLRSKQRRGLWGREGRQRLRAGDGKIPGWHQLQDQAEGAHVVYGEPVRAGPSMLC